MVGTETMRFLIGKKDIIVKNNFSGIGDFIYDRKYSG